MQVVLLFTFRLLDMLNYVILQFVNAHVVFQTKYSQTSIGRTPMVRLP